MKTNGDCEVKDLWINSEIKCFWNIFFFWNLTTDEMKVNQKRFALKLNGKKILMKKATPSPTPPGLAARFRNRLRWATTKFILEKGKGSISFLVRVSSTKKNANCEGKSVVKWRNWCFFRTFGLNLNNFPAASAVNIISLVFKLINRTSDDIIVS